MCLYKYVFFTEESPEWITTIFSKLPNISKIKCTLLKKADTTIISIFRPSQLSALLFSNTNCLKLLAHIPRFFLLCAFSLLLLNLESPSHPSLLNLFLFMLSDSGQVSVLPRNCSTPLSSFIYHIVSDLFIKIPIFATGL